MTIEAFPLQWPVDKIRTKCLERARFSTTFSKARDQLHKEIEMLGGSSIILSTDIPLRQDGLPYAARREPNDKGVAVYFIYKKNQMCFACDSWDRIMDNVHAICKTINALRGIARWGTGDMVEQAFSGFVALPEGDNWKSVLNYCVGDTWIDVDKKYKQLRSNAHPDRDGGSADEFYKLNTAWREAEVYFSTKDNQI